jgi:predicted PurR-regulated permease PerM
MSEKKVVSRSVAIGIAIICVILLIALVGAVAIYDSYIANHHHTDEEYNDLNDIVNLAKSTTWIDHHTISQPASSYTYWTFSANYAGYVSVQVHSSTTDNTYVRVIYSSHGVNYDNQIIVGASGTAVFPLLPSSSIEIRVGNSNWLNGATETVTIVYCY